MSDGDTGTVDPRALPLDALRRERGELQRIDDAVSFVRRVAQARIDLVRAQTARRFGTVEERSSAGSDELRTVLSTHLTGGSARPPRPVEGIPDHPLVDELDTLAIDHGFSRLGQLDRAELDALDAALTAFERKVSDDRRARHERLDALSSELVRRYRDGDASVDQLLEGRSS